MNVGIEMEEEFRKCEKLGEFYDKYQSTMFGTFWRSQRDVEYRYVSFEEFRMSFPIIAEKGLTSSEDLARLCGLTEKDKARTGYLIFQAVSIIGLFAAPFPLELKAILLIVILFTGIFIGLVMEDVYVEMLDWLEFNFDRTIGELMSTKQEREEEKERIIAHEAGHFFLAHTVGVPVTSYCTGDHTVTIPNRVRNKKRQQQQQQPQMAGAGGNVKSLPTIQCEYPLYASGRSGSDRTETEEFLQKMTCIAFAGIVNEIIEFGSSKGGLNDYRFIRGIYNLCNMNKEEQEAYNRWAMTRCYAILKKHKATGVATLKSAMKERKGILDCVIELEKASPYEKT